MITSHTMRRLMIGDAVIERGTCPIIVIDADNNIVEVSNAFCQLGDWSRQALLKTPLSGHIAPGVDHPHNAPLDWLAEKYDGKPLPSITRVPMMCGQGEKQILLDLMLMIAEHSEQDRPEFIAFVTEVDEQ